MLVAIAAKTISNYANHLTGTPLDAFMAKTAWVAPSPPAEAARGVMGAQGMGLQAGARRLPRGMVRSKAPPEAQALIAARIEDMRAGAPRPRILPVGAALPDIALPDARGAPRAAARPAARR